MSVPCGAAEAPPLAESSGSVLAGRTCVHVKGSIGFFVNLLLEASRDAKSVRVQYMYRFSALSVKLGENLSTAHVVETKRHSLTQ